MYSFAVLLLVIGGVVGQPESSRKVLDTSVTGCPAVCECYIYQGDIDAKDARLYIDCSARNLTSIPDLSTVKSSTSEYKSIYQLNLGSNEITSVAEGAFGELKMRYLLLDYNKITTLPTEAIKSAGIDMLDISGNKQLTVDTNLFKDLQDIAELGLSSMGFTKIPREAIANLKKLEKLRLVFNDIMEVKNDDFIGLNNLDTINLGYNKIQTIEKGSFRDMQSKRLTVYLENNLLTNLSFHEPCKNPMTILNVDNNPLHCDCDLFNLTRVSPLHIHGKCSTPERYANYTLYWYRGMEQQKPNEKFFPFSANSICGKHKDDYEYDCICKDWFPRDVITQKRAECLKAGKANKQAYSGVLIMTIVSWMALCYWDN